MAKGGDMRLTTYRLMEATYHTTYHSMQAASKPEAQRPKAAVLVAELMDSGGLGESLLRLTSPLTDHHRSPPITSDHL